MNPIKETEKRLLLAQQETERFRDISLGVILTGSVAYSPNFQVTDASDLDILVIVENLKSTLPYLIEDVEERRLLQNRFFEGYCIKKEEGIPISVHVLSEDAFDIISKCFVANIRVYRNSNKPGVYILNDFEGNSYDYSIRNITLDGLSGVRTIVPISFINEDRYYIGVHRDKLLSNSIIMHERRDCISSKVDKLWYIVVQNLCDESNRLYGCLDMDRMNVLNALIKKNKMSADVIDSIKDKTSFYLSKIR
ncbi:MAG: hypothetical protein ACTSR8_22665 [Promethearchaeota archaeon]